MTADFPGLLRFIGTFVPASVKQVYSKVRPFLPVFAKTLLQPSGPWATRDWVRAYWRDPPKANAPEAYLPWPDRSTFMTGLIRKYVEVDAQSLEIGCNAGRNMDHLYSLGFRNLEGIELNPKAVRLMKEVYPEMAEVAKIYVGPVEDIIRTIPDNEYDCVFTMGVLLHIHWDNDWIFPEIARITKDILITVEQEEARYYMGFARNYRHIFEALGMRQLQRISTEIAGSTVGGDSTARVMTSQDPGRGS